MKRKTLLNVTKRAEKYDRGDSPGMFSIVRSYKSRPGSHGITTTGSPENFTVL